MLVLARRSTLALFAFFCSATGGYAQGWQHVGSVQRVEKLKDGVELTAGRAKVRITAFDDSTVRVRVAPQGNCPKEYSWAVIAAPQPSTMKVDDYKSELNLTAGTATVIVQNSQSL